nr:CD209 antigen-like protein B [Drosophila suzukii]
MLPFFNYVAKESKCYITRDLQKIQSAMQKDNQGRLSRIESQQTEIQENLKYLLEILRNNIPENFEERLVRMEEQQTSLRGILKKIPLDIAERLGRMEDKQKSLGAQLEAQINAEKEQKSQLEGFKKTIPENFEERLTKMEVQQTSLQEALRRIPEDLEGRMDRMEKHETDIQKDIQTRMDTQRAALLDTLSLNFTKIVRPQFEPIGSRFFYIDSKYAYNWNTAVSTCREMGGYIASVKDQEELDAITAKLDNKRYWLGINNRASKGNYLSEASGKKAQFLKWRSGEPNNMEGNERCVELVDGEMNDDMCFRNLHIICQSDNEV